MADAHETRTDFMVNRGRIDNTVVVVDDDASRSLFQTAKRTGQIVVFPKNAKWVFLNNEQIADQKLTNKLTYNSQSNLQ